MRLLALLLLISSTAYALPVVPTGYWDASVGAPTLVDGAISSLPDLSGNGNNATQGTAANRPLLSRSDNLENLVPNSQTFTSWSGGATGSTVAVVGGTTSLRITENSATSTHGVEPGSLYQATLFAGVSYRIRSKVKGGGRNIAIYAGDSGLGLGSCINTTNGTIAATYTTGGTTTAESVTDLGGGWYQYSAIITPTSTKTSVSFAAFLASGTTLSYLGDGASYSDIDEPQLQIATASPTYVATTGNFPQIAGINGNPVPVFDGSNDSLATTIAVNPTGGMWGAVFVRKSVATTQVLTSAFTTNPNNRLQIYSESGNNIVVSIHDTANNSIGRRAPTSTITTNEGFILSWTYDGGTSASGIKIYKNGVRVDTADFNSGAYTVPTAGATLTLGAYNSGGTPFNGYLSPAVFGQGSQLSDVNRIDIEQALIYEYVVRRVQNNPLGQSSVKYLWQLFSLGSQFGAIN